MDPQRPGHRSNSPRMVNEVTTSTATNDAGQMGHLATQGLGPHLIVPHSSRTPLPMVAKGVITDIPEESVSEGGMVRESWASFASTAASRDSGVPSIFSARASTASALTRYSVRQSLMESPISPMDPEHRKSSFPQNPRYCCTFCEAAFDTKAEWKIHEFEFHDRCERYFCRTCSASFPRTALLTEHLKRAHYLDSADATYEPAQYFPKRSAWGCGFCAAVTTSRTDYLEHVGQHYDEGKDKSEWQHTRVIEALLQQFKVASAWLGLVSKEEGARRAKLRFHWDPNTTGRSAGGGEPQLLQDMLEFFATGTRSAEEVAAAAYGSAQVRLEGNVSDLISRLYLRTAEPKSVKPTLTAAKPSPELPPTGPVRVDDLVSPISPLPAPLQLFDPPRPSSVPPLASSHSSFSSLAANTPTATKPLLGAVTGPKRNLQPTREAGDATRPVALKRTLRRVETVQDLALPRRAEALGLPARHGDTAPPRAQSPMMPGIPPISLDRTQSFGPGEPRAANGRSALSATAPNTATSVRTHTSSSTLSTRAGDGSQRLDDSTSEGLSDDSVSEPDAWLEPGGIPGTTKMWKVSFQQSVTRGMGRLWARYMHDWEALIRECMGNGSSDSAQYRETPGRVRKGASSRQAPGKGLRPHGGPPGYDDDEEEDDGEGYRPPSSMSKRSSEGVKRFACPFRKHDPHTYNIQDHEVCTVRSWSTISRLKEHLYRRHYKTHCQRCKQTFNDAKELAEHEMLVVGCEVRDTMPPSDITTYQEKQLKSRKHTTRRQTDEEKWRDIYRLLFPNEEIPSPYPEPTEDIVPTTSESHTTLNFQHFLLNEMPSLFTRTAEEHAGRHLQARDGLPMEAIPRILEAALHKAFRTWEARGSELPTREASVASMTLLGEASTSLSYNVGQSTAYPTPQPTVAMDHSFPQSHFGNATFTPQLPHTSHADDSGFSENTFFASAPPVNFNTFAPQYERGTWDTGLGLMGNTAFDTDMDMGAQYRGYQGS